MLDGKIGRDEEGHAGGQGLKRGGVLELRRTATW